MRTTIILLTSIFIFSTSSSLYSQIVKKRKGLNEIKKLGCKENAEQTKKLLTYILKMPDGPPAKFPPYDGIRFSNSTGIDNIQFIYNKGETNSRYQIQASKDARGDYVQASILPTGKEFFHRRYIAGIVFPKMDYSNLKRVDSINAVPNSDDLTMDLIFMDGSRQTVFLNLGSNSEPSNPDNDNYKIWNIKCLTHY